MSKVDDILNKIVAPEHPWFDPEKATTKAKGQLLAGVLDMINSFEVESLPSDDPKLVFWQGYHQAQLDITEAAKERFK